jgi:CIC family chloride channel protein
VLEGTSLNDFFPEFRVLATANKNWTLADLLNNSFETHASDFAVVDDDWNYLGMISLRNVVVNKQDRNHTIINYVEKVPAVNSDESMSKALNIILEHDIDKVAVIEGDKYVGYVRYRDIFEAYNTKVKQI